jgi:hypothetical protein
VVCNGVTKVEDNFFLIGQDKLEKKGKKKLLYFFIKKIRVPIIFPMCSHMLSMMFPNGVPQWPLTFFYPILFSQSSPLLTIGQRVAIFLHTLGRGSYSTIYLDL